MQTFIISRAFGTEEWKIDVCENKRHYYYCKTCGTNGSEIIFWCNRINAAHKRRIYCKQCVHRLASCLYGNENLQNGGFKAWLAIRDMYNGEVWYR